MRLFLTIPIALAFACGSFDGPPPPSPSELEVRGGCGDVVFYAWTRPESRIRSRIVVSYPGLLDEALASGETIKTAVGVNDPNLRLVIESGEQLDSACSDDGALPIDVTTFEAVSGVATFTVVPTPTDEIVGCARGRASVSLDELIVEAESEIFDIEPAVIEAPELPGPAPDTGDC